MIPQEFSWRTLTEAIVQLPAPPSFLQERIFKKRKTHPADTIEVDLLVGGKKLAPFVSPIEEGVVVERLGRRMQSIKCPRIRVKKALPAEIIAERTPGANYFVPGGQIDKWIRQKIGYELQDLKDIIVRRIEWMCAKALSGKIVVSQENISFEVNYGLPSSHKKTSNWESGDPIKDLRSWKRLIQKKIGIAPDTVILGPEAVDKLLANESVRQLLDNRRIAVGKLNFTTENYIGTLAGMDLFEYAEVYEDEDGNTQPMIPENACTVVASRARFALHFGLILDLDAGAQVIGEMFAKSWVEKDPSVMWLLAESRPLPVPHQPESIVYATV